MSNMCETSGWFWICVGIVIVILMVLSGRPFVNPIGQMTEVGKRRPMRMLRDCIQWKMSSSQIWTLRETLLRVMRNCEIADMRSARIVWTAARSILCENSAEK